MDQVWWAAQNNRSLPLESFGQRRIQTIQASCISSSPPTVSQIIGTSLKQYNEGAALKRRIDVSYIGLETGGVLAGSEDGLVQCRKQPNDKLVELGHEAHFAAEYFLRSSNTNPLFYRYRLLAHNRCWIVSLLYINWYICMFNTWKKNCINPKIVGSRHHNCSWFYIDYICFDYNSQHTDFFQLMHFSAKTDLYWIFWR